MWGYVVLNALAEQPVRTQAALAQSIGADKSRIIGVLDELQERGLIQRRPDPAGGPRPLTASTAACGLAVPLGQLRSWASGERRPVPAEAGRALAGDGILAAVAARFGRRIGLWADDPGGQITGRQPE